MAHFADRLAAAVSQKRNGVLVGIDPRANQLPDNLRPKTDHLDDVARSFETFGKAIIDVVADLVPAVKPQAAFFEQLGPAGMSALANTIKHARSKGQIVILDGKRNDIGSTAEAYAAAYLGESSAWQADALTVSPYLGDDSLDPFVKRAQQHDAGIFVLVKTSNPGGKRWQDLVSGEAKIYEHVADHVESLAAQTVGECGFGCVGAVVGATYPEELVALRQRMPHTWFLVPGFGSQGGTARDVAGAFDDKGMGAIVNSSRGIIFAHQRQEYADLAKHDWQRAVEQATKNMIAELNEVR